MFGYLTLFTGLALSTVAAWFAVEGIMAIFAGLPMYGLAMGVVIELGKVVGITWIYRNWSEPTRLKFVMIPTVLVAMLLTSMGIFGLLSKAHIEQTAPVTNNTAKIERLDQRITREQAKISDAETVILQLDDTVETLIEYDKISGPDGARAVRDGQQEQRDFLALTIDTAQDAIDAYEDDKLLLNQELNNLEREVGPVRYIAALVYENPEHSFEEAVRLVIIAFIFVFDPMAILLLMAANYTLMGRIGAAPKTPPAPPAPPAPPPAPKEPEPSPEATEPPVEKSTPPVNKAKAQDVPAEPTKKIVGNHGIHFRTLLKEQEAKKQQPQPKSKK